MDDTTVRVELEQVVAAAFDHILDNMAQLGLITSDDPNFTGTPSRVGKAYAEIFLGLFTGETEINKILSATFPSKSDQMITVGPVHIWSMCPHHFLPVEMYVWLSYIPAGKVLGLSKLARLAGLMAARPALQEDTTSAIAKALFNFQSKPTPPEYLTLQADAGNSPLGAGCYIRGRHLCMCMRGVKQDAWTISTALEGNFLESATKAEFLAAVGAQHV